MAVLRFDVRVVPPTEPAAERARDGTARMVGGDRAGAEQLYREAAAMPAAQGSSWINLAALALALGDSQAARAHALDALQFDRAIADAWVNLGAASWNLDMRREAAQATHRALDLWPSMEAAAWNLKLMYQAVGQVERARTMLAQALTRNPRSARLHEAMADASRLLGDTTATRTHALAALPLLQPALAAAPSPGDPLAVRDAGTDRDRLHAAMTEACARLQQAGIAHLLIGGVVLGIAREGEPFAGDKDIDIALDDGVDRDAVAAALATGFTPVRVPAAHAGDARRWCMGYTHEASGIGIDLFFMPRGDTTIRQGLGWPDQLFYDYPAFVPGTLAWRGRDWPVPAPLETHLASNYGDDWRSPRREVGDGRSFDKRWFDTQVSCPGLVAESLPRAVSLVLLRLLATLRLARWEKALALCDQVLARESIDEVEAMRRYLLAAGIR